MLGQFHDVGVSSEPPISEGHFNRAIVFSVGGGAIRKIDINLSRKSSSILDFENVGVTCGEH